MNVLFHINNDENWKMVLGNVKNMINTGKELGEVFIIEVVANGNAVLTLQNNMAIEANVYTDFTELAKEKVTFVACNNALNKFALHKENLLSFVEVVPSGVIELARKQAVGYSYIKP